MVSRAVRHIAFAALAVVGCVWGAGAARAQTPEHFAEAVREGVVSLLGNEIDSTFTVVLPGATGCPDSLAVRVDLVGFALCAPGDPWAAPTTSPAPGVNGFGCVNAAGVSAVQVPPGSRIIVEIALADLFVTFRTSRDAAPAPADSAAPGDSPARGEGYLVAEALVSMPCDMVTIDGCTQLAPVAPSTTISLETRALELRGDACLSPRPTGNAFPARVRRTLEAEAGNALRDLILMRMDAVNEELCGAPGKTQPTWAPIKPRSGSGG